jgi:hypothetical protein
MNIICKPIYCNKKWVKPLLIIFTCIVLISSKAISSYGESGWIVLKKLNSSRFKTVSVVTPVDRDLSGIYYNPALNGTLKKATVFASTEFGIYEDTLGSVLCGYPFGNSALSAGFILYDAGKVALNWIDNNDNLMEKIVRAQIDSIIMLSYGRQIKKNLYAGFNFKYAESIIAEKREYMGNAFVGDFSAFFLPSNRLSLAVLLNNVGQTIAFHEKKESLPTSIYFACGYLADYKKVSLLLTGGMQYSINDDESNYDIGAEISYMSISFNMGHQINIDDANLHFGITLIYKRFEFGMAYIPSIYLNSVQRLNINYQF